MNEKELRKKIREELQQNHEKQKERIKASADLKEKNKREDLYHSEHYEDYQREAVIRAVEEEVCSKYPEMIECTNHLGEVRWLTPLELNNEYEFYPLEKSVFERFKNKFFKSRGAEYPKSDEWNKFISRLRTEMDKDVHNRIALFRQKQAESQKHKNSEIEAKIYEEEIDRFYKSKKGYKKYKNHLGEFRWMTKEEAENQDEFFEEEPSLLSIWLVRSGIFLIIALIAGGLWYFFAGDVYQPKGYLLLEGNSKGGSLYIDKNLAPGFNYNVPYPVSTGTHEISVIRDGYVTTPSQQQVIIDKNDTVSVRFNFEAHASTTMGYVKILNNIDDARIYVDNNFYGNLSEREIITLKSGRHTMSLEKEGYRSDPFEQQFELPARDTIEVNFTMRTGKSADARVFEGGTKKLGLIEVRSNVKNAEIYINGEKTDYRTDYVLQKMSFGQYVISIKKQGYQSYPDERVVRVDRDNMRAVASFTLSSTSNMVTIRTKPVKGEIFINGRPAGEGEYKGSLPIGEHKISFGDIEYYNKPEDQTIMISGDGKNEFEFEYTTSLHIEITPEGISPEKLGGRILSGYVFNNSNLIADSDNGPELKSVNGFDHKVWYLGYTFQYRNPPGSDALEFEFTVPSNIDLSQPLYLKVWGYRSGTNYPIVMRGNAYYQIIVNGNTLREKILPKYSLKEIGEDHFDTFRINDYLRHGMNKIFISTTDDTSEELALWKVSIR